MKYLLALIVGTVLSIPSYGQEVEYYKVELQDGLGRTDTMKFWFTDETFPVMDSLNLSIDDILDRIEFNGKFIAFSFVNKESYTPIYDNTTGIVQYDYYKHGSYENISFTAVYPCKAQNGYGNYVMDSCILYLIDFEDPQARMVMDNIPQRPPSYN